MDQEKELEYNQNDIVKINLFDEVIGDETEQLIDNSILESQSMEKVVQESSPTLNNFTERNEELPEEPELSENKSVEDFAEVLKKLNRLEHNFETKIKYDEHKQTVIDRMHTELQEYKNDVLLTLTKPLFMDLIKLYDDVPKISRSLHNDAGLESLHDLEREVQDYILEILEKYDVYLFKELEDIFNPRSQQAIRTTPTSDQENVRKVTTRLRPGFKRDEKILRPEGVEVLVYKPVIKNEIDTNTKDIEREAL